ncbi:MAG TPA: uroporphyrinogen-III synthase [Hanamia sp.]|nr:uroporphyrinogen-III synthase [Hanamia sp.]
MQNKVQILSTKKIGSSFIKEAVEKNICIDEMNFIDTKENISAEIRERITDLSKKNITAIFTSSNAVNAVEKIVSKQTNWKIFCIEPATKKVVEQLFPDSSIVASAKDAAELAEKITNDNSIKEVVFFCGNQRRNLLPAELAKHKINVEELVVYQTIETPQIVSKKYDGILFFSPSAVRSFFTKNKLEAMTQIFAIGKTTADEVKSFSNNSIVISEIPGIENLIAEVIKYFSPIKTV